MARLTIHYPGGRRVELELDKPELVIGRDADCDVPLDDAVTSRRHARLVRAPDGAYWVEDLQSKNGTLLNDEPITRARIKEGDFLEIGGCRLSLTDGDSTDQTPLSASAETTCGTTSAWGVAERLDLPRKRLEMLYELNDRLTGLFDRDDLLKELLDICRDALRFERAGIAVWEGAPHPPKWIRLHNLVSSAQADFHISRSVVERTLHHAERILIVDTADAAIDPTASMISNNIRSAMCVPMEYHGQVRGVIYGDRISSTGGYNREDIDFFAALGRLGAMGLVNVQLVEEMHHRREVELQLSLARQIQSQLFPSAPLRVAGMAIDALNDPGQKVSGDYYDYLLRDDGRIVLVIADVAGKGVGAALLMANLQAAVHTTMTAPIDLALAVRNLNRLVCRNAADSRFITGIFCVLDPAARRLEYVNAGHLAPYRVHDSGLVEPIPLEATLPLGVDENFEYTPASFEFTDLPASLFLYTDGVPDAHNEQGEMFEERRLAEALKANIGQEPAEMVARIRRTIKQFTRNFAQTDDITMVVIRVSDDAG